MVRAPGFEPGFPRWQRGVITTTLRSQRLSEMEGLLLSIGQKNFIKQETQDASEFRLEFCDRPLQAVQLDLQVPNLDLFS